MHEEIRKVSATCVKKEVNGSYLSGVENRLDKLEREENMNVLIMSGVPIVDDENLKNIIVSVSNAIKYDCDPLSSIVVAYRLSSRKINTATSSQDSRKRQQSSASPIFVRFVDFDSKMHFLSCYLKSGLNISQIGFSATSRIYINKKLTPKNYEILKRVKLL